MNNRTLLGFHYVLGILAFCFLAPHNSSGAASEPLAWDAESKQYTVKTNETHGHLFFSVTNVSNSEVIIENVTTSCDCTAATLPSKPWKLAPKQDGKIEVVVDVRGKTGTLTKQVSITSPTAPKMLSVSVTIPPGVFGGGITPAMGDRLRNQESSAGDRQAVFKADCARCHLAPAFGKFGGQLYKAACAICHDSPHRATMVPDLHKLNKETNAEYWKEWITHGKTNTLMPGFIMTEGGPLDQQQIDSLVDYMLITFNNPTNSTPSIKPAGKKP
ncbi:MAG: hypothetical protein JWQ71_1636 [Pedosphaera sp.]|nr:hypothetical protein [Pedosphaera sp.]